MKKKAQSEVISTVILILIVITAGSLIAAFVINYVRDHMNNGCTDIAGKIEIKSNPDYTCYDNVTKQMRIQIHVGDIEENSIKNIRVLINRGGSTDKTYIINNDTLPADGVSIYNNLNPTKIIPAPGEDITYLLNDTNENPDSITLGITLNKEKEEICPSIDNFNTVNLCH
jgi:flagellin-like protein